MKSLFALLPLLAVAGCSGDGAGCPAVFRYDPLPAFAGSYRATFSPTALPAVTRTYEFQVAETGTISGTVEYAASSVQGSVEGQSGNLVNGCDRTQAGLRVLYQPTGASAELLEAGKRRNGAFNGTYAATLTTDGSMVSGSLTIVRSED